MDGWPVAWCGTGPCGIPASTVSTGYWADCKPFGVRAQLESVLKRYQSQYVFWDSQSSGVAAGKPYAYVLMSLRPWCPVMSFRASMEECRKENLEACELEAIRPVGKKCGSSSGCSDTSTQTTLASYN